MPQKSQKTVKNGPKHPQNDQFCLIYAKKYLAARDPADNIQNAYIFYHWRAELCDAGFRAFTFVCGINHWKLRGEQFK